MTEHVVCYTTAEKDYDWWFATDLGEVGTILASGKKLRRVLIEASRAEGQMLRYGSGNHAAWDRERLMEEVAAKFVTLDEDPPVFNAEGWRHVREFAVTHENFPNHVVYEVTDFNHASDVRKEAWLARLRAEAVENQARVRVLDGVVLLTFRA